MDKKVLHCLYIQEELPLQEIADRLGGDRTLVAYYARKYGFPKRNKTPVVRTNGEKIGDWTLLKSFKRSGHTIWECKCKCGYVGEVEISSLNRGGSNSCKTCAMEKTRDQRVVPSQYFYKIQLNAGRRKIPFSITQDYIEGLWEKQQSRCALTGLPLSFAKCRSEINAGLTTASLDRIDSEAGYIAGNVQWTHKDINRIKQGFPEVHFISLCRLVVEHSGLDFSQKI